MQSIELVKVRDFAGQVAEEFSPDGTRVVAFSARAGELSSFDASVWEVSTGKQFSKAKLDGYIYPGGGGSSSLNFSLDGSCFSVVSPLASALFDATDGHRIGKVEAELARPWPWSPRFTSRGSLAFTDSEKFNLVDVRTGRPVKALGHGGLEGYWGCCWAHDGGKVAAIHRDGAVKIWNLDSGEVAKGAKGGTSLKRTAIFSPDNNRLVVQWGGPGYGENIPPGFAMYDANTGESVGKIELPKGSQVVGFSPDSKTLLTGGAEFSIFDSANGGKLRSFQLLGELESRDW